MKTVITYGTYDLLHPGHIRLLKRAKALGDRLIVALSTDEFNWNEKQKKSYYTYEQRKELLEAIKYVDLVIPEVNWDQKKTDVHKYSKIPLIGGATGYITSLVVNVIKGLGQEMKIEAGDVKAEGKYSMVTCCNGNFYGGGFNPIKDANPADGQMNVLLTKNISRLQAAGLIGAYGDGRYYEVPDVITRVDTNKVHVKLDKVSVINIDGEAIYTDDLTVELIPGAVNFIVPEGMTYFDKKPE